MPVHRKAFKLALILPVFLLMLCLPIFAQEVGTPQPAPRNSLVDGSWSMQFRIVNDFQLSSFEGTLISAKRHFSDKSAFRFGIAADFSLENTDSDNIARYQDRDSYAFTLNGQYIHYTSPGSAINFYLGIGPHLHYNSSMTETEEGNNTQKTSIHTLAFGAITSYGLEYFLTRQISLICEYGAGLRYTTSRNETEANGLLSSETDTDEFRFFSASVDFGLSVYF